MGEAENIAKMAEMLSGSLLGVFGWSQHGPINFNFQDDTSDSSRRTKHPCDVIFGIEDPYLKRQVFYLADLKSYNAASVDSKDKLRKALGGLAASLQCARTSGQFKKNLPHSSGEVNALLFVYNNDAEFDKDFGDTLLDKAQSTIEIPYNSRLYVLGPGQIQFLSDIVNDLEKIFGEDVPTIGAFRFFYPNMITQIPERNEWPYATPEVLISPFITVLYTKQVPTMVDNVRHVKEEKQTTIYYRGDGSSVEEFCILFDYCFRYSLIDDVQTIKIKMPYSSVNMSANFDRAKQEFSEHFYKQDGGFAKLKQITLQQIPTTTLTFYDNNIGMEKRKEFANAV